MKQESVIKTYRDSIHELYAYVSRRCGGNRSLSEDVTQEAWLRALEHWRKKGPPDEPLAWLKTVARNLLANYYRRIPAIPLEQAPPGWDAEAPDQALDVGDPGIAGLLNWGLARLKADQAAILEAFHFERLKVAEIAAARGLSERAVEGRLRRARHSLRRILGPHWNEIGGKS